MDSLWLLQIIFSIKFLLATFSVKQFALKNSEKWQKSSLNDDGIDGQNKIDGSKISIADAVDPLGWRLQITIFLRSPNPRMNSYSRLAVLIWGFILSHDVTPRSYRVRPPIAFAWIEERLFMWTILKIIYN